MPSANQKRPLHEIASDVRRAWVGKSGESKVYFGAEPYLAAMEKMVSIDDNFGYDRGRSIVAYFLGNANSFRGPVARAIKAELRGML